MRHCSLVLVDFPARSSLKQIYGTFVRGLLKLVPTLRSFAAPLTEAMIDVYTASQKQFLPDVHPHYIYSPRELSRWVRGMYGAVAQVEGVTQEELVRLWLHEVSCKCLYMNAFASLHAWVALVIPCLGGRLGDIASKFSGASCRDGCAACTAPSHKSRASPRRSSCDCGYTR